jgi:hypothetical protein
MREPFTDESNTLCERLERTLSIKVPPEKGGSMHYGSDPTSSRRMFLSEVDRVNRSIEDTAMKLNHIRKGAVSFAVYETLGDDAEKSGRSRDEIRWDTVDKTCSYYEEFKRDENKKKEIERRRIALEFELDELQRVREHLLSVCMGR